MTRPVHALQISRRLLLVLVVLLVPLFVKIPAHLRHDELIGPLGDRYHVALFLALTVLLNRHGPLRGRPLLVMAAGLGLGGATELLQLLAGRSASPWDWYQDALGVGLGGCWIWWRRTRRPAGPVAVALVLLALVAWPLRYLPITVPEARAARERFPLLDDFERPNAVALWGGHDEGEIARVALEGQDHVLEITSTGDSRWPGAASSRLPWDWSGYTTLRFRCRLRDPAPASMWLSVLLKDRAGPHDTDYALFGVAVDHEWQHVEVPLTALRTGRHDRPLALDEIWAVAVFVGRRAPGPVRLQLDDLRLGGR